MADIEPLKLNASPEHRLSREERKHLLIGAIAIATFFFNVGMTVGSNIYGSVLVLIVFVVLAWLDRS